jgi:hypothetical protein
MMTPLSVRHHDDTTSMLDNPLLLWHLHQLLFQRNFVRLHRHLATAFFLEGMSKTMMAEESLERRAGAKWLAEAGYEGGRNEAAGGRGMVYGNISRCFGASDFQRRAEGRNPTCH